MWHIHVHVHVYATSSQGNCVLGIKHTLLIVWHMWFVSQIHSLTVLDVPNLFLNSTWCDTYMYTYMYTSSQGNCVLGIKRTLLIVWHMWFVSQIHSFTSPIVWQPKVQIKLSWRMFGTTTVSDNHFVINKIPRQLSPSYPWGTPTFQTIACQWKKFVFPV